MISRGLPELPHQILLGDTTSRLSQDTIFDMASRICWSCGTFAHHTLAAEPQKDALGERYYSASRCDQCGVFSVGHIEYSGPASNARVFLTSDDSEITWEPTRIAGKDFPDVPEHIASAANEAHRSFSISSLRAAILLARAVVEATAKDKGITKGTLADKIDELEAQGIVRAMVKETAHEIRYIGNSMAHGDFVAPVTSAEAEDVLAFMDEVLNEVYQSPARLNARRAARLAASQTQP